MNQTLTQLSPNSRIWIFQSDRFLNPTEESFIHQKMQSFIPQWASHGDGLFGGFSVEDKLFLIIGVDENKILASGCSIDTLTHEIQEIGKHLNIDFFNRMAIAYLNEANKIELTSMTDFKRLINENKVNFETIVFNNLVHTKQELDTKWKTEVKNSWHTNLFQLV